MSARRRLCGFALVAAALVVAPRPARADETSPANVAAAQKHFDKARAFYSQGAYREAIGEFEAAHSLDPSSKYLVFNLGVVHEKLVEIDEALKWFRLYLSMNVTPQERERAEGYVRRLEGAKAEVEARQVEAGTPPAPSTTATPSPPAPVVMGRIDALTIGGASVTAASLVLGVVLAIKAESDKPPANYVTGRNGSFSDLQSAVSQSHAEAVGADVGFGVAIAAAAATTYLYLSRTKAMPAPASAAGSASVSIAPSIAPIKGGGALFVQGSF